MSGKPSWLVRAEGREEHEFRHPWEPKSLMRGVSLSDKAGLKRTGVNLIRIPPGHVGSPYHEHKVEEEWLYVLEGRALSEVNGERVEIGPGDFCGFPAPGFAHIVESLGPGDLVLLVGGESAGQEVGDFPKLGRRMVRVGDRFAAYPLEGGDFLGLKKL